MSLRSNEGRLAPPIDLPDEVKNLNNGTDAVESQNRGPLEFITPTEFVELPSRGKFYSPNHPLHNQEVLEVKHMTTKEEDILTSVALLRNGIALDRMLESIIVNKNVDVQSLLVGDKNALIISSRAHAYGTEYNTSVNCPSCSETQEYSFDLSALKNNFPSDEALDDLGIQLSNNGTFLIKLPKSEYVVEVRLLTGHDENYLRKMAEHKKKKNFPETPVTDLLRSFIISVNGVTAEDQVNNFINTLPAIQARYLRRAYNKLIPSLDLDHSFVCSYCDHQGDLEVPLNADFFWPNE